MVSFDNEAMLSKLARTSYKKKLQETKYGIIKTLF